MLKQAIPSIDLLAEAQLDEMIQYHQPIADDYHAPRAVFLTGATGFLGAYLLYSLLQFTRAEVYCLVRCADSATGMKRVETHLQTHGLLSSTELQRVHIVQGDLAQPFLGLSATDYQQLAREISVIYHNGAQVNALRPYDALKATNVSGTQTILHLASLYHTKPVHFISTVAVFFSPAHRGKIAETLLPDGRQLQGGYRQTKWVAEELVRIAQARGLPACIYRPGRITGHSQTGAHSNLNDLFCLILKACIQLGYYPDVITHLNLTPIDYVSLAVVQLSQQPEAIGKTFHLLNPQNVTWLKLMALVKQQGYSLTALSYADWSQAVTQQAIATPKEEVFTLLRFLLRTAAFFTDTPIFKVDQTIEQLSATSLTCPVIDEERMAIYLSYFQKIGFICACKP
ncbi:thioester reductase domain-containing protein [Beggiatoa leptomitoformis]|uniref:NAD-dependent epimerase/dehydratase family protein n=1 Tax=Beggiatoa leptomitoformis TaxID=288004 RepID=A0A2N9YAK4_9GAMM|nr:thioester reductase domain-containing protein [Beggiatoa leptomitoformis]ALG67110.1 NAD-dependent epimerase/dehydratase family protein [Beggiatoa leptomitoformis]AUI67496.1 NAD-dependent epimerase/dehydratase family protein [Beggiatoa leptomitoformis]